MLKAQSNEQAASSAARNAHKLVHEDPLHLIATYDDDDDDYVPNQPGGRQEAGHERRLSGSSPIKQHLTKTLVDRKTDLSHHKSSNVYIDETSGTDNHPIGSRQMPFQSLIGAVKARETNGPVQMLPTYYFKKRFVNGLNDYNPVEVPHTAIPIDVGGFATLWWFPVDSNDVRAARVKLGLPAEGVERAANPSTPQIPLDKEKQEQFRSQQPVFRDDASVISNPPDYDDITTVNSKSSSNSSSRRGSSSSGFGFLKKVLTR